MYAGLFQALGGLGLFLLGMAIMTGALRSLADERMRRVLARAVNSPVKGAITGALSTAVLQSSSATTVAAVGFVGAGLLTFPESLGIIFGANIGTTVTGWVVAVVGFKLQLGQTLLPLILLGVLLRMTGRAWLHHIGTAVAGFGLIFVGLDSLQAGMEGLEGYLTPDQFPPDTPPGRLLLVLIGIAITAVTQSSSAGVAAALTAVNMQTISLNQAAAMVIGMNVGTTTTAALATIGGNVGARRTGFAHVIYNVLTGITAFLLLTPYMQLIDRLLPAARMDEPEFVLVGFHTFFNFLGVIMFLPFTGRFGSLLIRLFPERGNPLTRQLDRALLGQPAVASQAVESTLLETTSTLVRQLRRQLGQPPVTRKHSAVTVITDAIDSTRCFLEELAGRLRQPADVQRYISSLHVLDHLRRIHLRLQETNRLRRCRDDEQLSAMTEQVLAAAAIFTNGPQPPADEQCTQLKAISHELKSAMKRYRLPVLEMSRDGRLTTSVALRRMDTARSLRRIGQHIWRIAHHLGITEPEPEPPPPATTEAAVTETPVND
jgi:phosphate:Na+ symporter